MKPTLPLRMLGLATLITVIAAGCSQAMQAKSVAYYRAHPMKREALLKRCTEDPGRLGKTAACVNVEQAEAIEGIGSFRKLAPMHWPAVEGPGSKNGSAGLRPDGGSSR